MSSDRSLNTISDMTMRPDLARVFQEARAEHKSLPLPGLVALAQKVNVPIEELIPALAEIVKHGFAQRIVRVVSPIGGGIGDFKSIEDVPNEIYDDRQGREISVQPENLVIVYKF